MRWLSSPHRTVDSRSSPVHQNIVRRPLLLLSRRDSLVSLQILFVSDLFHPIDDLAGELFLNRDVRHGGSRHSPMPVLLAGWDPHHVTGPLADERYREHAG